MDKLEQQKAHEALPPAFMRSVINQSRKEPEIKAGKDRDKVLADGADSDFWKVVKSFIEAKQMMLAKQLRETSGNVSVEETGFRFLILDQVNTFATQLVTFVEAPKEILKLKAEEEPKQ